MSHPTSAKGKSRFHVMSRFPGKSVTRVPAKELNLEIEAVKRKLEVFS